jgi:hypothetical protein
MDLSSAAGGLAKVKNTVDNITHQNTKFQTSDFINLSAAPDFISKSPLITDIVKKIDGLLAKLGEFADMIIKFLEMIMSFLDLENLFSKLGLDQLMEFIFKIIFDVLGNGSLKDMDDLFALFGAGCALFSNSIMNEFGFGLDASIGYSLMAILMAMACLGTEEAYGGLYDMFSKSPNIQKRNIPKEEVDATFGKIVSPILANEKMRSTATMPLIENMATVVNRENIGIGDVGKNAVGYMNNVNIKTRSPSELFTRMENVIDSLAPRVGLSGDRASSTDIKGNSNISILARSAMRDTPVSIDSTTNTVTDSTPTRRLLFGMG